MALARTDSGLKILYLTEIFPDPKTGLGFWGGGERQFYELARRVASKGHQVTILTCRFPGQSPRDHLEGLEVIRTGISRNPRTGGATLSLPKVIGYFGSTIRAAARVDCDIIHCNAFYPVIAGRVVSSIKGIPMVSTFHDLPAPGAWEAYTDSYLWSRLGYLATVAAAKSAKGEVLTVSENAKSKLVRQVGGVVSVIPNGVDISLLDSAGVERNEGQVLYVGRLVKYKRVGLLISAFKEVAASIPDARLVIVGDGPERMSLESMASSLPSGRISFTGTLSTNEGVAKMFRESSVFVLPSVMEGEGIVLKEAMASRLPVVATRARDSGVLNLVDDGKNGLLVEPDSPHALAESIVKLLSNKQLRDTLGAAGRRFAEKWSWEAYAETVLERYRRALAN